jgi:Fe-S-cluster containining protein
VTELEEIYASMPTIQCKRKCQAFCGPIIIGRAEFDLMSQYLGYQPQPFRPMALRSENGVSMGQGIMIGDSHTNDILKTLVNVALAHKITHMPKKLLDGLAGECGMCPNLNQHTGLCEVYEVRPLICRAWGMLRSMRCPHGCQPSRLMDDKEFGDLVFRVMKLHENDQRRSVPQGQV